jgi:cytochrome c oxidase subunit 2
MIFAYVLILMTVGSVVFHLLSPWWWTEIASNWTLMDTTIEITFWITGVAFVAIMLFTAYCVIQFRHQPGRKAAYEPENTRLEWILTIVTTIGVAAMLAPGLVAWNDYVNVPEDAVDIEVVGQQWQWTYRLPGADGKLGKSDAKFIIGDNVFGVDPNDPNGQDDVLIEDGYGLHIELGQNARFLLRSIDVLHDFYVPQFRAKMDLVPGMVTYFWLRPTRTGEFPVLCAELCGTSHHDMRGSVFVDDTETYQAWLQEQETFKDVMAHSGQRADRTNVALK